MSFNTGVSFQRVKKDTVYRLKKVSKPPYYQNLYQNIVAHKSPFAFEESFVPTKRPLRYLERTNRTLYGLALEVLNEQRSKRLDLINTKIYRHRETAEFLRYTLTDLIDQLLIVPDNPIPEFNFKRGYSLIIIRNKDKFEFQVLDSNSNYLTSFHCHTDRNRTTSPKSLYDNLRKTRVSKKVSDGAEVNSYSIPFLV